MKSKIARLALAAGLAAVPAVTAVALSGGGAVTAGTAVCIYEVGFGHLPGATVGTTPPKVTVDDGDPYVRKAC